MHFEFALIALFSVATAVALVARRFKVPYTVALVVAGLALGRTAFLHPPPLTKELLYAVFLPGLVFEAAFSLEFKKFWQNKLTINALAVPGLVVAIGLTSVLLVPLANGLHFIDGFEWKHALVFAALIAATDPIAVVSLFKSLGAPKRLGVLVEGESLLNDGTAVVFLSMILTLATGGEMSLVSAVLDFVRVVGMGILIGAAVGYTVSEIIHKVDDPMIEITLTTIAAYGSFVAAEHFHFSGVIATVVAGMLCGNYAARTGMSPTTRVAVASFWDYLSFALNSVVFLLIGFEVRIESLLHAWQPILAAYVAVTIGRTVVIYGVTGLLGRTQEKVPASWTPVLVWGGLRGSLSMVLALALPHDMPFRELLVTMTFGVVLLSILVQGLTMGPLLRRLGLLERSDEQGQYERLRAEKQAARAALHELQKAAGEGNAAEVLAPLRSDYEQREREADQAIEELHLQAQALRDQQARALVRRATLAEKAAVLAARQAGQLSEHASDDLLASIDARLLEADAREH